MNTKFEKIGVGYRRQNKLGKHFVCLKLDPAMLRQVYEEDFGKIFIFENSQKLNAKSPDFYIRAPVSTPVVKPKEVEESEKPREPEETESEESEEIPF